MNRKLLSIIIPLILPFLGLGAQTQQQPRRFKPSFGLEYTGELQTDFRKAKFANLLHLSASLPLGRGFTLSASTISTASTSSEYLGQDLQGFSNIESENIPLAIATAGVSWQIGENHNLFVGIRRMDEDYFCTDAMSLFTNSSCGCVPTISANVNIATFPLAAVGLHYAYSKDSLTLQASLYNGEGNKDFTGRNNVFRFCPNGDGVFALSQAEYRYRGSIYEVGMSVHSRPACALWLHTDQRITDRLTMVFTYSYAFGNDVVCRNFCTLGATYSFSRVELGLISNYTRIEGVNEFAHEATCKIDCNKYLSLQPSLHLATTGGSTACIGTLRACVSL